jgi:phosphatidate cytidylyltransferase
MEPPAATPPAAPPSKAKVFAARLTSTLILWGIIYAAFQWQSALIMAALIGAFGIGSAVEFFGLFRQDREAAAYRHLGLLLCTAYWTAHLMHLVRGASAGIGVWLDVTLLIASLIGGFVLACRRALDGAHTLNRIFMLVFGSLYTAVLFGFLLRLLYWTDDSGLREPRNGMFLLLFVIAVTKMCDTGAYVFGSLFGRRKMIPHISPAKSWEGLIGAFITGIGIACLICWLAPAHLAPLTWGRVLIIAPLLCLAGVIGDLAESVLKRCTHIKDSGHTLPGIGGILDLTDSLLFTVPVFYGYLRLVS